MGDNSDLVDERIERENDALVAAALRVAQLQCGDARVRCANCGEDLAHYRREFGLCVECARAIDANRARCV